MTQSSILFAAALLAAACNRPAGDAPLTTSSNAASATTMAANNSGASATTSTTASTATITAVTPPPAAQLGPCAQLALQCAQCPVGVIKTVCSGALTAGAVDPSACTNALNDKDIKSQCGGGANVGAGTPNAASGASGPCAQLALKCAKCPAGIYKQACNGALTAGSVDPRACTSALADKDIKAQCN